MPRREEEDAKIYSLKYLNKDRIEKMNPDFFSFLNWHRSVYSPAALFHDYSLRELADMGMVDEELRNIAEDWFETLLWGGLDYILKDPISLEIAQRNPLGFVFGVSNALSMTSPQSNVLDSYIASMYVIEEANKALWNVAGRHSEELVDPLELSRMLHSPRNEKERMLRQELLEEINTSLSRQGANIYIKEKKKKGTVNVFAKVKQKKPRIPNVLPSQVAKAMNTYFLSLSRINSPSIINERRTPEKAAEEIVNMYQEGKRLIPSLKVKGLREVWGAGYGRTSHKTRMYATSLVPSSLYEPVRRKLHMDFPVIDTWMSSAIPSMIRDMVRPQPGSININELIDSYRRGAILIGYDVSISPEGKTKTTDVLDIIEKRMGKSTANKIRKMREALRGYSSKITETTTVGGEFVNTKTGALENMNIMFKAPNTKLDVAINTTAQKLVNLANTLEMYEENGKLKMGTRFNDEEIKTLGAVGINVIPGELSPFEQIGSQFRGLSGERLKRASSAVREYTRLGKMVADLTENYNHVITYMMGYILKPGMEAKGEAFLNIVRTPEDLLSAEQRKAGAKIIGEVNKGTTVRKIDPFVWCVLREIAAGRFENANF